VGTTWTPEWRLRERGSSSAMPLATWATRLVAVGVGLRSRCLQRQRSRASFSLLGALCVFLPPIRPHVGVKTQIPLAGLDDDGAF
jgi:hypothetical protein